jgi:hypothetical protein
MFLIREGRDGYAERVEFAGEESSNSLKGLG